jgi:hypothetical protein
MAQQVSFSQGAAWLAEVDQVISGTPDNGSRMVGILQDSTVDFSWTTKQLWGQNQYPAVIARGEAKVTLKFTFAALDLTLIANNLFGAATATGQFGISQDEQQTVPASSPYTFSVANASSLVYDLGVRYSASGVSLQRVTTPSAAGQYSVNYSTGVYTFSASDANVAMLASYHFTNTATGQLLTVANQLQGATPYFRCALFNSISPNPPPISASAVPWALCFNAVTASKVSMPRKVNEFTILDIEAEAFADGGGTVCYISTLQ